MAADDPQEMAELLGFSGFLRVARVMNWRWQPRFLMEFAVPPVPQQSLARFATLSVPAARAPRRGWGFSQIFLAPFRDVDDRVARMAAANERERKARQAAMSDAAEPRR
jgi:hypothetical protein